MLQIHIQESSHEALQLIETAYSSPLLCNTQTEWNLSIAYLCKLDTECHLHYYVLRHLSDSNVCRKIKPCAPYCMSYMNNSYTCMYLYTAWLVYIYFRCALVTSSCSIQVRSMRISFRHSAYSEKENFTNNICLRSMTSHPLCQGTTKVKLTSVKLDYQSSCIWQANSFTACCFAESIIQIALEALFSKLLLLSRPLLEWTFLLKLWMSWAHFWTMSINLALP